RSSSSVRASSARRGRRALLDHVSRSLRGRANGAFSTTSADHRELPRSRGARRGEDEPSFVESGSRSNRMGEPVTDRARTDEPYRESEFDSISVRLTDSELGWRWSGRAAEPG